VASPHVVPPPPMLKVSRMRPQRFRYTVLPTTVWNRGHPQPPKDMVTSVQVVDKTIQIPTPKDAVESPHVGLVNDEGAPVTYVNDYHCGDRLGTSVIPGSDGMCGPTGTQCQSCVRFQELNGPPKMEGTGDWKGREVPQEFNDFGTRLDDRVGSTGPEGRVGRGCLNIGSPLLMTSRMSPQQVSSTNMRRTMCETSVTLLR